MDRRTFDAVGKYPDRTPREQWRSVLADGGSSVLFNRLVEDM